MKKKGFKLSLKIFAIFLALCAITLYLPNIMLSASASAPDDTVKAGIKSEPDALDETNSVIRELAESLVYTDVNTELETESSCMASETEYIFSEESESNTEMEIIGGMVEIQPPGETAAEIQVSPEVDLVIRDENGDYVLQGGVYAFENVGNEGLFMDIQQDKYLPGYHMQQYAANGNPAETFDRSCLFKITWRPATNSYIIRSMLNNRLSFYFSGNEVLTKEIEPRDADVPDSDTFRLIYNVEEGYFVIKPYNSSNVVAANDTTASGMAGAPSSYLKKSTETDSGDQARWIAYRYAGDTHSGVVLHKTVSTTNGIELGSTIEFALKTWTTVLGKNTPYMKVTPGYEDMVASSWDEDTYTFTITAMKAGELKLRPIIYHDGTTTAFRTYVSTFTIYPYLNNYVGFIKNSATGKYMDIEGPSKSEGAIIQQWTFNDKAQSKWQFSVQSGGYFTIKSQYSNMYVGVDSTATTVIRQYSTKSDYTLWKFIETTSGNYKLICKATESSGNVLATASKTSGNGSNLTMTAYIDDDNYRDEWNPQVYVVFDNMKIYKGESSVFAPHALKDAVDDTPTAFTYTVVSGTDIVSIDNSTATITAHNLGTALIRVTNIAGSHLYFKVCVPKRAIIIVPGIMGSELISRTDETKFYWDETILNSQSVTETIGKLNNLLCDLEGNSINDIVPYNNKYGFMDEYMQLHVDLENNLGDKYEIDFFAYDWRLSNAISGERLNEFIEKNNFEKVVLVCHSMGGLVASSYLAMGEKQRGKVETMVSLGTPYLGTPVMIQVWKSADIKMLAPTLDNIGADIMEFLAPVYNHLSTIVWNYRSIYELLPSQKYYDYIYEDYPYITDTVPLNDPLTLLPMNGPELLLNEYGVTKAVLLRELPLYRLDMANAADAFHNSLYINEDHVTAYVNTYYFAASYDNSNDQTDNTTYKIQFLNVGDYAVSKTVHGDQMVPVWSADIVNKYPNRTFYKSGIIHGDLVHDSDTFKFIKNLISHDLTIPPDSGITTTGGW